VVKGRQRRFAAVPGEHLIHPAQTVLIDQAVMFSGLAGIKRHDPDRLIIDAKVKPALTGQTGGIG